MNPDEVFSLVLSNCKTKTWTEPFKGVYSGQEIKYQTLIGDPSVSGCIKDLITLYRSTRDDPHTNLYYSLLRISLIGLDSPNISAINHRGIVLNCFLFIIEFFIFTKLLLLLFGKNNRFLVYSTLMIFGLYVGGISNTILLREYQLQELAYVLLTFYATKIITKIEDHSFNYNLYNFIYTTLSLSFIYLTGYFSIIYVGFLGIVILHKLYKEKETNLKRYLFFILSAISSLIFSNCLYLHFYLGLKGDGRIKDMLFSEGSISRIMESIISLFSVISANTIYPLVGFILVVVALLEFKKLRHVPWIVNVSILYCLIIFIIAPYKVNRYIAAATPMLILIIPSLINYISNVNIRGLAITIVISLYIYNAGILQNIDNLSIISKSDRFMKTGIDNKVWIVQSEIHYPIVSVIPYMDDNQTYHIVDSINHLNVQSGDLIAFDNVSALYKKINLEEFIPHSKYIGTMGCFKFYEKK